MPSLQGAECQDHDGRHARGLIHLFRFLPACQRVQAGIVSRTDSGTLPGLYTMAEVYGVLGFQFRLYGC